jgi:hypothetical protein
MLDCWARAGLPLAQPKVLFGTAADPQSADGARDEVGGRRQSDGAGATGGNGAKAAPADAAEALVVTYLLNNDEWSAARAAVWEAKVASLLESFDPAQGRSGGWKEELSVSYSVERAVEDEIARGASGWEKCGGARGCGDRCGSSCAECVRVRGLQACLPEMRTAHRPNLFIYVVILLLVARICAGGSADVMTVALSYVVMLCYVSFAIGKRGPGEEGRRIGERLMLAATGLVMVLVSILVAAAFCSVTGVPATMILSEVIPFLGPCNDVCPCAWSCVCVRVKVRVRIVDFLHLTSARGGTSAGDRGGQCVSADMGLRRCSPTATAQAWCYALFARAI